MTSIDEQIRALQMLKEAGFESAEAAGATAGTADAGNAVGAVNADAGTEASGNGYYELKDCKVVKVGEEQVFGDNRVRTITFEYMSRGGKMVQLCGDAWNDTLKYNTFSIGSWWDISLRLGCRTGKDGRDWANVSVVYAHRLREVGR